MSHSAAKEAERISGLMNGTELSTPQSHHHRLSELELHIELAEHTTTISAAGTASARVLVGEILAWLGCACRASSKELEIKY